VPQYQTPFSVVDGQVVEIEQDTPEEISQCTEAVLRTVEGTLIDQPEFGRPDESFAQISPSPSAEVYLTAIDRWEPRARVLGDAVVEGSIERIVIQEDQ
jgi:phage baseplate assembly protein W